MPNDVGDAGNEDSDDSDDDDNIPSEPLKTLVAFIFLFFAWVATTTSLALTHERVPQVSILLNLFSSSTDAPAEIS